MAIPTSQEWQTMLEMAEVLVASHMLPQIQNKDMKKEQAVAVILKGHELGLQPMQSFAQIHIISRTLTASSGFMLALLAKGGVTWKWLEDGRKDTAVIEFSRANFAPVRGTFSMEEALQAKLLGNDTWKKFRAAMLRARAVANGARMIGPDLLMGMSYTPEEMGAEVDENEDPIDPIGPSGPPQTPPDAPPAGLDNDQPSTPVAPEPPGAVSPDPPDIPIGEVFIAKAGEVIDDIDDEDQIAIVLTSCGFGALEEVPATDYRRVYNALKEKRQEMHDRWIVKENKKLVEEAEVVAEEAQAILEATKLAAS